MRITVGLRSVKAEAKKGESKGSTITVKFGRNYDEDENLLRELAPLEGQRAEITIAQSGHEGGTPLKVTVKNVSAKAVAAKENGADPTLILKFSTAMPYKATIWERLEWLCGLEVDLTIEPLQQSLFDGNEEEAAAEEEAAVV